MIEGRETLPTEYPLPNPSHKGEGLRINRIPHMLAKEIKPGVIVVNEGSPCLIEGVHVQSPSARGGATLYKFRARNLVTKQKVDITLKGTDNLADADFEKRAGVVDVRRSRLGAPP